MSQYDSIAGIYDLHFARPVDRWEDARLAARLRPIVDGRDVLDLGCGTGWLADHCAPSAYTGVDESAAMLAELVRKHPGAATVKAAVGTAGWTVAVPQRAFDVITCTWALQYLGSLDVLLATLAALDPGVIALHGYLPRYRRRAHEITGAERPVTDPHAIRGAGRLAGLPEPAVYGTGSLPDGLARYRVAWELAARLARAEWHYAALWTWRLR